MADLLAKQDLSNIALSRNQQVEGEVIAILDSSIILDLGRKAEGVLAKKDLSPEVVANLKIGEKIVANVIHTENESGQVVLSMQKFVPVGKNGSFAAKFKQFEDAKNNNKTLTGTGLEVNRGGLIVEVNGARGFLPSSQVSLAQAANLDNLVGKTLEVTVIEVDPSQNRLIFSQKTKLTEADKQKLSKLKVGDIVGGKVAAVLAFGVFATLENGVEGLVHVSELSWEKVEDPSTLFKIGDEIKAKVVSVDTSTGKVNLSIKQLAQDPFEALIKDIQPDDIVKGEITKVTSQGVSVTLASGVEGFLPANKQDTDIEYKTGESISFLVDSIDTQKRRVNLVPFITSTKDLIYK